MDFLDPKKRRSYNIRLFIGYFLLSIAIVLGTIILVYATYGYGINTKTGQIVQNGLLFLDSKPSGVKVSLNGADQNTNTAARLVLPSGEYSLSLTKTGYRDWKKTFTLEERSVKRFLYPILFPTTPQETNQKTYSSLPSFVTDTLDSKYLLIQAPGTNFSNFTLEQFDTNDGSKPADSLIFPSTLFSFSDGQLQLLQWSTDNTKFLVKHFNQSSTEYLVLNKSKPAESVNVNKLFNTTPVKVSLYDNKADKLYINGTDHSLKVATISDATLGSAVIKQVQEYKALSGNLVVYASIPDSSGQAVINIWDNGQTYKIASINTPNAYLLDAANFQGQWYYAVNSNSESGVNIYQDPEGQLKDSAIGKTIPIASFSVEGINQLSFSPNGRNIVAGNGKDFASYDVESKTKTKYSFASMLDSKLVWLDSYHLETQHAGKLLITDFDGDNQQVLGATSLTSGAVLSRDSKHLLTIRQSAAAYSLVNMDLRAGSDLPK